MRLPGNAPPEGSRGNCSLTLTRSLIVGSPCHRPIRAWAAGTAAVVLGAASLLWPTEVGATSGAWAVAALAWGFASPSWRVIAIAAG